MIAKFKKTSRTRWTGAMLLLAALACIVLTNAYVAKADFIFGTPTLVPNINHGGYDYGTSVSSDGLELYFSSNRSGGLGGKDLWFSRRATTEDDWGIPENLGSMVNSSADDASPDISSDGLELYFDSHRSGGSGVADLWVSKRATTDEPWGIPVNLGPTVNSSAEEYGADISSDSLELYFSSDRNGYRIWVTRRATTGETWGAPVSLESINEVHPSISANGLTLLLCSWLPDGDTDIWIRTRATTESDWGTAINLGPPVNGLSSEREPTLSHDGRTLYFTSDRPGGLGGLDIWQAPILPVVDFNSDGKVDLRDFRILAQYWGQNEPSCDIAPLPGGDGIVDEKDLNLLAEHLLKELQPVAHWKLNETQGNVAEDSMGNNDGMLHGNPVWQPAEGAVGGALLLDGEDDYIEIDYILDPSAGSFSVFVWIKGGAPGQVIISQKDTTEGRGIKPGSAWLCTGSSSGRFMTELMSPLFDPLISESIIADGQWHHVGLVYDLDGLRRHLYVDGTQVAQDTDSVGGMPSDGGLYIGAGKMLEQGTFFSGLIDDIRIYDEVLSADEVADLSR